MTVFDVIDGVAEYAAGFAFLEDGVVYAGGGGGRDDQARAIKIAGQKLSRDPNQIPLDGPLDDLRGGFGGDDADTRFGCE